MMREDYLMRLIRQFVDALARMTGARKRGDFEAADAAADELYEALGISRELVEVVDSKTLAELLRDPEKIRAAARLFWDEGHLLTARGDPLNAFVWYRRAHEMFLEARALAPEEDDDAAILELSRVAPAVHLAERYRAQYQERMPSK